MKHSLRSTRSAFTLIELLVVIAIIAILAAILFPVFARARENARRSSCQSNLKQVGLGIMQYIQDYDEKYPITNYYNPPYAASSAGFWNYGTWRYLIQPYVKSGQLFTCPSALRDQTATTYASDAAITQNRVTMSGNWNYGVNEFIITTNGTPFSAAGVNAVSLLPMAADSCFPVFDRPERIYNANHSDTTNPFNAPSAPNPAFGRHFDGSNILFADGHVKFRTQGSMVKDPSRSTQADRYDYLIPMAPDDDRVR